jgi:MFS family permease
VTERASSLALLRENHAFRRLWLADTASLFGDWFNTIALYTAVDRLLGTSEAVGWVIIAKSLPVFLASPIAGPLVDRLPRRRLMIASALARGVLSVGLVGAWALESVVLLYALTVLSMACAGVFLPAKNAATPALVEAHQLGAANSAAAASWSVTLALGAALGGFATQWLGITASFVIDALSYFLSVALLRGLPELRPQGEALSRAESGFVAGVAYFVRAPQLVPVLLLKTGMALTAGAVPLITVYGNRVLSSAASPAVVGALFAARGIGAAIGSLGGRHLLGESRRGLSMVAVIGFGALAAAYAWMACATSLPECMIALVIGGSGNALVWLASTILLQREVGPQYLGRAFALDFGLMTITQAVVIQAITALVDSGSLTLRAGMGVSSLLALVPGILLGGALLARRSDRPA